jgi:hypothetical protein
MGGSTRARNSLPNGSGFATRDGLLVTGQENFSGSETADLIIETLGR